MTQYSNAFEGQAIGTTLTTANSGGVGNGTAFNLVQTGGAPSLTYSPVGKVHGTRGVRAILTASDKFYLRTDLATAAAQLSGRFYFTLNSLPGVAQNLMYVADGASAQKFALGILSGSVFRVVNAAGATLGQTPAALTAGVAYRVEYQWKKGTSTTDGQMAVQLYVGDQTTAYWTYSATNVNVGVSDANSHYLGDGSNHVLDLTLDSFLLDDATQTPLGPLVATAAASLVPTYVASNAGGFTLYGTPPDGPTGLADTDDATGMRSGDSPASATLLLGLGGTLAAGNASIVVRLSKADNTTVGTVKVGLLNAAGTLIAAEQTFTVTTTPTDYTYALTTAENNALTTRSGLQLRIIASA